MRLQGETRELLCELTAEDLESKGRELAAAVETEQDLRADLAEWWSGQLQAKKARKEEVTRQEGVCAELAGVLQRRQERRSVSCTWLYALAAGYAFLTRDDTGELVTHRKLRDEERQMEIGEPPFAEPTPEQLGEWLQTLPVNEEQTLPEGHADDVTAEDQAVDLAPAWEADPEGIEEDEDDPALDTAQLARRK